MPVVAGGEQRDSRSCGEDAIPPHSIVGRSLSLSHLGCRADGPPWRPLAARHHEFGLELGAVGPVLDMRGHGESIRPTPGVYSLPLTADDALALIAELGLERPVLIGHSWGGATAMVLASGAGSQQPVPALSHVILEDPA